MGAWFPSVVSCGGARLPRRVDGLVSKEEICLEIADFPEILLAQIVLSVSALSLSLAAKLVWGPGQKRAFRVVPLACHPDPPNYDRLACCCPFTCRLVLEHSSRVSSARRSFSLAQVHINMRP